MSFELPQFSLLQEQQKSVSENDWLYQRSSNEIGKSLKLLAPDTKEKSAGGEKKSEIHFLHFHFLKTDAKWLEVGP